jgi:hypothetical protein
MHYRNYLEEIIQANTNLAQEEIFEMSVEELEFYCGF